MKSRKGHRKGRRPSPALVILDGQGPRIASSYGDFEQQFLASAKRLRAAGLIESIVHDSATGEGVVTFTPACHQLMLAGRQVFEEPGFVATRMTGDPDRVRQWVESEAALLRSMKF